MNGKLRRHAAAAALVAAAFTAFGAGPSFGDTTTSGDGSTGGGNQAQAPVSVPVNICGNAVGVLGKAAAECKDSGAVVYDDTTDGDTTTSGDNSIGGGNQAQAPISAPVNICGNAISGGGEAAAECKDSGAAVNPPPDEGNNPPPDDGTNPPPDDGTNPPPDDGTNPPPADDGSNPPPADDGSNGGDTGTNAGDESANPPPNMAPDEPAPAAAGPGAANSGTAANASDDLPFTGSNTVGLAGAALAALGLGAVTVWIARRRQSRTQN